MLSTRQEVRIYGFSTRSSPIILSSIPLLQSTSGPLVGAPQASSPVTNLSVGLRNRAVPRRPELNIATEFYKVTPCHPVVTKMTQSFPQKHLPEKAVEERNSGKRLYEYHRSPFNMLLFMSLVTKDSAHINSSYGHSLSRVETRAMPYAAYMTNASRLSLCSRSIRYVVRILYLFYLFFSTGFTPEGAGSCPRRRRASAA